MLTTFIPKQSFVYKTLFSTGAFLPDQVGEKLGGHCECQWDHSIRAEWKWRSITTTWFIHKDDVGGWEVQEAENWYPIQDGALCSTIHLVASWPDLLFFFTTLAFLCRKLSLPTVFTFQLVPCTIQSGQCKQGMLRSRISLTVIYILGTNLARVSPFAGGELDTDLTLTLPAVAMHCGVGSQ